MSGPQRQTFPGIRAESPLALIVAYGLSYTHIRCGTRRSWRELYQAERHMPTSYKVTRRRQIPISCPPQTPRDQQRRGHTGVSRQIRSTSAWMRLFPPTRAHPILTLRYPDIDQTKPILHALFPGSQDKPVAKERASVHKSVIFSSFATGINASLLKFLD